MEEIRTNTTTQSPSGVIRTEEVHHTKKSRGGLVVGLVILLLILLALLWLSDGGMQQTGGPREIAPGQTLTEAAEGQVVGGFPTELLLEPEATTDSSYSIAYTDGNISQPVVSYRSAKTLGENVASYKTYLEGNGWNITHQADENVAPVTFFYAYKANAEVNITFASDVSGVMVTIAYVLHQQ
ncbi:MAG: hypothetical protein KBD16_01430 [Candidatus Pacebacteria bacterium]|nr:hypothetical protein [Candidatus Paceibacterota bacterium]